MAPNFQSSFIPKGPITEKVFEKKKTGPFGALAVFLFIISIIIAGSMFIYKGILESEIKNLESQLVESEKNIDRETINKMSQFSKKLDVTKSIVSRHQVISGFLDSLASSTVSLVQFTDFSYSNIETNQLVVTLHGKAASYATVALQESVFSQNKNFRSVSFSNLTLADKGLVSFDLKISVDPQVFAYVP